MLLAFPSEKSYEKQIGFGLLFVLETGKTMHFAVA